MKKKQLNTKLQTQQNAIVQCSENRGKQRQHKYKIKANYVWC